MAGGNKQEQRDKAIASLMSQITIQEAANESGLSESTLYRWLRDPDFREQYREARRQLVEHAVDRLLAASVEAVAALREVLQDREAAPGARVSAAKTILEMALRAREIEELEERISELEKAQLRRAV